MNRVEKKMLYRVLCHDLCLYGSGTLIGKTRLFSLELAGCSTSLTTVRGTCRGTENQKQIYLLSGGQVLE